MRPMTKAEVVAMTTEVKNHYARMQALMADMDEQFLELEVRCPDPAVVEAMRLIRDKASVRLAMARVLTEMFNV